MQVYDTRRGLQTLHYRSFHAAAQWTYAEGNRPLHRTRWEPRPENFDAAGPGKAQNRGESVADVDRDDRAGAMRFRVRLARES
jgi:hypothetical protein